MNVKARAGDSLFYYSKLFAISHKLLIDSNATVQGELQGGETIRIPGFLLKRHKLTDTDTVAKLASKYHHKEDALLLVNQQMSINNWTPGKLVNIPERITSPVVKSDGNYAYKTLISDLAKLREVYPFVQINICGQSVMKKKLYELRIGTGRNKVHWNASFHANEWITTNAVMTVLNEYLIALTNFDKLQSVEAIQIYNDTTLSIVPMVNPDGVDLVLDSLSVKESFYNKAVEINNGSDNFEQWKANIRGIDLNNQYPANWDIEKERKEPKAPAPRDYPGDAPLTEPEAIALAKLVTEENFSLVVAFHTQGREFYWGYESYEPAKAKIIADRFAQVSGYKSVQFIDSHAGFKDWFIQNTRNPGFTIELGEGTNPLPLTQLPSIVEAARAIGISSLLVR
ncbi:peptidase M14 [Bacillus sp. HMF5848]|uniref:M14 family metallopeptidase n=1 Tax=Bacillus sp. HMF5848 TaxID=2495421 RepID=UPI000F786383|nr:M14 family metallocarboxypeptidase [Bacillus sp. HMF5848]RSK27839.1 peptidase M14 [Bacillus sp. HMF5848]